MDQQDRRDIDGQLERVGGEDEIVVELEALAAQPAAEETQDDGSGRDGEAAGGGSDDMATLVGVWVGNVEGGCGGGHDGGFGERSKKFQE